MSTPLPSHLRTLIEHGELSKAEQTIREILPKASGSLRVRLEFELDRIRRWRYEFPYTLDQAFMELRKLIPDLQLGEINDLLNKGCLDYAVIDGEIRFLRRFASNALWLCPRLKERSKGKSDEVEQSPRVVLSERVRHVTEVARSRGGGYVLPLKYRAKAEVIIKPEALPIGECIRVWIPLPRQSGMHRDIKIIHADPLPKHIASIEHPQRTAYFEVEMQKEGAQIVLEFEYTSMGFHVEVDPKEVSLDEESQVYETYTRERPPHIVFTPYLRELAHRIVRDEANPYLKARRIWDWITSNVKYTYARDYALYDCISEYVARERRGDCGMQALLFITLCRIVGVPARWESGWYMNPVRWGMHDWAQFYIEPYGWLYADPSFGSSRHEEGWRTSFYFGSTEGYRLASNIDISTPFDPPKTYFRSDPVDNQRGEAEWSEGNLYYDKWDFKLELIEVKTLA